MTSESGWEDQRSALDELRSLLRAAQVSGRWSEERIAQAVTAAFRTGLSPDLIATRTDMSINDVLGVLDLPPDRRAPHDWIISSDRPGQRAVDAMADPRESISRLLAGHGYHAQQVRPLGSGLDHTAFEVDGALVVRLSAHADPAERALGVDREARLLHRVAAISPLPVPAPLYTDPEGGWFAYRKLPGEPLLGQADPTTCATTAGAALGRLLAVLHGQPPADWAGLVEDDDTAPHAWLREAREAYADVAAQVPPSRRGAVEAFLDAAPPPPATRRVLSHNDLGIEHVLVDPTSSEVTGVIDWSDAALVDPARDLGLILRDLGAGGLDAALLARSAVDDLDDDELRSRAGFYARCGVLEDLAYGVGTGRGAYVRNSLAALARLFASR